MGENLREAWRCISNADGHLRSMLHGHRPKNTRNVNAVKQWLLKALDELEDP